MSWIFNVFGPSESSRIFRALHNSHIYPLQGWNVDMKWNCDFLNFKLRLFSSNLLSSSCFFYIIFHNYLSKKWKHRVDMWWKGTKKKISSSDPLDRAQKWREKNRIKLSFTIFFSESRVLRWVASREDGSDTRIVWDFFPVAKKHFPPSQQEKFSI